MLLEDYDGQVPTAMDELLRLPGVARKTANVVVAERGQAEGIVVDTHVRRLSQRLGLTRQDDPVKIERDLMRLVPREHWNVFPHLLIWHGRRVCIARTPRCEVCVLNDLCPASRVEVGTDRVTRATPRLEAMRGVDLAIYADALAGEAASLAARAERARSRLRQAAIEKRARRELTAVAVERLEALGLLGAVDELAARAGAARARGRARCRSRSCSPGSRAELG